MSRILVTGGAGYIGAHTVRALSAAGHEVAVVDNLSAGHRDAVPDGVDLHVHDLATDPLDDLLAHLDPEAVVHFAGATEAGLSMREPRRFYRDNVVASLRLADALLGRVGADGQLPVVVYSSSAAVYATPPSGPLRERDPRAPSSVYGQTKLDVENLLDAYRRAYGLRATALRYFNAAGAAADASLGERHRVETHLIPLAISHALGERDRIEVFGTDYPTPDGTCVRDYVHVEDLADAHVLAVEALLSGAAGAAYNVGTGAGFSVREVLDTVEHVSGVALRRVLSPRRPGDPAELVADPTLIRAELGWTPRHRDLAGIVRSAWAWHRPRAGG